MINGDEGKGSNINIVCRQYQWCIFAHHNPVHWTVFCNFMTIYRYFFVVVCREKDRNEMRSKLLTWMKTVEVGLETEGKGYKQMLKDLFLVLDENNDTKLDTMEFVKLLEGNETVSDVSVFSYLCLKILFLRLVLSEVKDVWKCQVTKNASNFFSLNQV